MHSVELYHKKVHQTNENVCALKDVLDNQRKDINEEFPNIDFLMISPEVFYIL